MSRFHAIVVGVLALTCALGCREATAPLGELTVADVPATVVGTAGAPGAGGFGQFTVDVTLRNPTASTILVAGCGPSAELEVSPGRWELAFQPMCSSANDIELAPFSERAARATIYRSVSGGVGFEVLRATLGGRYRLVYGYWTVGVWGDAQLARSAPIEVTE